MDQHDGQPSAQEHFRRWLHEHRFEQLEPALVKVLVSWFFSTLMMQLGVGAVEDLEFLLASELEARVGAPPVVLRRFQKTVESLRPRPLPAPTGPSSVPPSSPCSACSFFLVLSSNA